MGFSRRNIFVSMLATSYFALITFNVKLNKICKEFWGSMIHTYLFHM